MGHLNRRDNDIFHNHKCNPVEGIEQSYEYIQLYIAIQ